jgi:hypothetical protein
LRQITFSGQGAETDGDHGGPTQRGVAVIGTHPNGDEYRQHDQQRVHFYAF